MVLPIVAMWFVLLAASNFTSMAAGAKQFGLHVAEKEQEVEAPDDQSPIFDLMGRFSNPTFLREFRRLPFDEKLKKEQEALGGVITDEEFQVLLADNETAALRVLHTFAGHWLPIPVDPIAPISILNVIEDGDFFVQPCDKALSTKLTVRYKASDVTKSIGDTAPIIEMHFFDHEGEELPGFRVETEEGLHVREVRETFGCMPRTSAYYRLYLAE